MNKIIISLPIYTTVESSSVAEGMARLCRCEMCPVGTFDCPFTKDGKIDRDICRKMQAHQWEPLLKEKNDE